MDEKKEKEMEKNRKNMSLGRNTQEYKYLLTGKP